MDDTLRAAVMDRARSRCEAWRETGHALDPTVERTGGRCTDQAEAVHHRLFKSRGGRLADDRWPSDERALLNLLALCRTHHDAAHAGTRPDLVVRGWLETVWSGYLSYVGPDPTYATTFGPPPTLDLPPWARPGGW